MLLCRCQSSKYHRLPIKQQCQVREGRPSMFPPSRGTLFLPESKVLVNALNSLGLYCSIKERGRGSSKRQWGIEMNESRRLYLNTYGAVDRLDHLIQNCRMGYRTWKYWHAGMLHAKAMAVVVAYDIYLECCDGLMRAGEWRTENPVSFYRFREKLSMQMLQYTPDHRKYPGDERFRTSTQQHKSRRAISWDVSSGTYVSESGFPVKKSDVLQAHGNRLCGDLTELLKHLKSVRTNPNRNSKVCVACGKDCYHCCFECVGPDGKKGVAMHVRPCSKKGKDGEIPCFYHYHDTNSFGLARNDWKRSEKRSAKKSGLSLLMPTVEPMQRRLRG